MIATEQQLAPGLRIIIRDEEWAIKKVETNSFGGKTLYCVGISPLVQDQEEVFIAELEQIDAVDPKSVQLIPDKSSFFVQSRLYIESHLRQKTPTDAALHVGYRAAMDSMDYQLLPASIALRQPRQRILIADSVGLGKTLEAGILLSELISRGKGKRILVVTVKSMMTQFQKEMWNRFDIPLTRLDSNRIARIRAQLPSNYNPFYYFDKTIISVDTLKRDIEYRTHLEKSYWDIIVIDEAHNVAERGRGQGTSQRSRLAQLLADRSDTLIMLSATPHDGSPASFASLMNMLDKTAIPNPTSYTKEDVGDLCIRRFKRDVKNQIAGSFQERSVFTEKCDATTKEEKAFYFLSQLRLEMDLVTRTKPTDRLFRTIITKSLLSSPAACLVTIKERIKRTKDQHPGKLLEDIAKLEELQMLLEAIGPGDFSRYQKLLSLLRSSQYGWKKVPDDRIVIFTERIETMRFLTANLRHDLGLKENEVVELYGGMSDKDQQKVVEDFGRSESPIRILVASDVASEGINLHYLSHRLIHFDIPWSLMVFQQRNGRIDRYGQTKKPDIRYLVQISQTVSGGDIANLLILIKKEKAAYDNIGDPALLMGKFNIEEEEAITAAAIENGLTAEQFDASISENPADFQEETGGTSMLDALLDFAQEDQPKATTVSDATLFGDLDYLSQALSFFSGSESYEAKPMTVVEGIAIKLTSKLKTRLSALLPEEAMPGDDTLRLSPNKTFCMEEMRKSMQNSMDETSWPQTQYLWSLHPIFSWVNDKSRLLFGRGQAPLIGIGSSSFLPGDTIYLMAGTVPNRKSAAVIDEWFGLLYRNGKFEKKLTLTEALEMTGYGKKGVPNTNRLSEEDLAQATASLGDVVDQAHAVMDGFCEAYNERTKPILDEELEKLEKLEDRSKAYQLSLFDSETYYNKRQREERRIEAIFSSYEQWYRDTIEIEKSSYLRVVAVFKGVSAL